MATSSVRFTFPQIIHRHNAVKLLFSNPNFHPKSIRFLSSAASPPSLETLPPAAAPVSGNKWEPYRKKKVVMRVGYVGTDYKGLQMQKDDSVSSFDTESTGSFFPDRSTSLGALMGVTTMFPTITFRTPPHRRDITPTITLGSTPNNRISVGQRRRKKDKVTNMVAERRKKRVRRWNWWRFSSDEDTKPSKLWELMEVERRFGVEALFSNELTDVNLGDHHRNDGRMLFANGRVLPPPNVTDVDEGTRCACSMFGLPVLLAAICSCGGGVR